MIDYVIVNKLGSIILFSRSLPCLLTAGFLSHLLCLNNQRKMKMRVKHIAPKQGRKYMTQYRSTLIAIFRLMSAIKLKKEHIQLLKKTPFWLVFDVFLSKRVDASFCMKSNCDAEEIIKSYLPGKKAFKLGNKTVRFRDSDIQLLFGISCGDIPMNLIYAKKPSTPFIKRRFPEIKRLDAPLIKEQLLNALKGKRKNDIEDVARLLCLYLCLTLFFATTGQSISWAFVNYIEDLDAMKKYAWSKEICNSLLASLDKKYKFPEKVTGCVIALQYWVCERTKILEAEKSNDFPRFLKWNLCNLHPQLKIKPLKTLKGTEVIGAELRKSEEEKKLLGNEKSVEEEGKEEEEEYVEEDDEVEEEDNEEVSPKEKEYHNSFLNTLCDVIDEQEDMDFAEDTRENMSLADEPWKLKEIEGLNKENEGAKKRMLQLEEENNDLKVENKRLKAGNNEKHQEITEVKQKLKEMEKERSKFEDQIQELKQKVEQRQKDMPIDAKLEDNLNEMDREIQGLLKWRKSWHHKVFNQSMQ